MSDNGLPFNSAEFKTFVNMYAIQHVTSSPGYPQSNGKAENAVKPAKRLMCKAQESGADPFLALLDWRNTPTEGMQSSPVQRLFGRRTKTLLPMAQRLLKPQIPKRVKQELQQRKVKQRHYYNRGAREMTQLQQGELVRMRQRGRDNQWEKAVTERQVNIRSYQVRTEDGRVYRRNRRLLRNTREAPFNSEVPAEITPQRGTPVDVAVQHDQLQEQPPNTPQQQQHPDPGSENGDSSATGRTSRGRAVKVPAYLQDYVR